MNTKITKITSWIVAMLAMVLLLSVSTAQAAATWTPRYIGTTVNGVVTPQGYYEYLPSSYNSGSPLSNYPIVIFMHGSGENGNGTATATTIPALSNVLNQGVPHFINSNTSPLQQSGGAFDTNNVIVVCPQHPETYPVDPSIYSRPFLNFLLAAYPKIDKRRIWLTGLSYGSSGVTAMMDSSLDPSPDDAAACVPCAWVGDAYTPPTNAIAKVVPMWALSAQNDTNNFLSDAMTNLASAILGSTASVNGVIPGGITHSYTAYFNGSSWVLSSTQVDPISGVNPKLTLFSGGSHSDGWNKTYSDSNVWTWLFQQQKPDVGISTPSSDIISTHGTSVSFAGSATDKNSTSLTGSSLQWISSIDGVLGTGTSLSTSSLSYGYHTIKLQATDNSYRDNKALVHVTVPYTSAFTAYFDFGPTGISTTGWNDVKNNKASIFPTPSVITNAVNSSGTAIGINLGLNPGFFYANTNGVSSSTLYPTGAQQGSFEQPTTDYGGNPLPNPQITISGLSPSQTYNFTFFASTTNYEVGPTNYTIGSTTVGLNPASNTSNTVSITGVTPSAAGQVVINLSRGSGAYNIYIGVLTITSSGSSSAPAFTDGPPPSTATVGTSYSFTYTASGTPAPTFTLNSGTLPPGLSLASNGVLSGTPTTSGVYSGITVKATNSNGNATTSAFSITVNQTPSITNGPATSTATVGTSYSFTYTATGYPTPTFTVSAGSLPSGLSLSSGGTISGTPTTAGTYSGTVRASNGIGTAPTQNFSIVVSASGSGSLVAAVNCGYTTSYTASDGTVYSADTYYTSGSPYETWDTISSPDPNLYNFYRYANGSGFSYAIPVSNGNYVVTLRFCETNHSDGIGARVGNYSLQGTTVLSNFDILATAGAYDTPIDETFNVTVSGGTLNIGVAIVTGSPRLDAIVIRNPSGTAPTISGTAPGGSVGTAYSFSYTVAGSPTPTCTVSAGSLPSGLSLSSGGTISGTPTTAGTYSGTVTATNTAGSASQNFSINVLGIPILTDFGNSAITTSGYWNNVTDDVSTGTKLSNMIDSNGTSTGVSMSFTAAFTGPNINGSTSTSGVFPASAMQDSFYTQDATVATVHLAGLSTSRTYTLTFFGSRMGSGANRVTAYTVGSTTITLDATDNSTNTVSISGITPGTGGTIDFTVKNSTGSGYGYLGVLEIQ